MARKNETNPIGGAIELLGRVPWWIGVVLAFVLFIILDRIAAMGVVLASSPNSLLAMMAKSCAQGARYLIPLVCY